MIRDKYINLVLLILKMTSSTETYEGMIDVCIKLNLDSTIPCSHSKNAKIVLKKIFENAKKDVFILDANLDPEIYEDIYVVDSAKDFLKKEKTRLIIALDDFASIDDILERFFIYKLKKNLDLKEKFRLYDATNCSDFRHYMVMDEIGYRQEYSSPKKIALANFADRKDVAYRLHHDFIRLIDKSRRIELQKPL